MANLAAAFTSLPEELKNWLAADDITNAIDELTQKAGLKEGQAPIVAKLVLRIAVQDLDPRELENELMRSLNIDEPIAKKIMELIYERIFKPKEGAFKKIGVDPYLINFPLKSTKSPSSDKQSPTIKSQAKPQIVKPPLQLKKAVEVKADANKQLTTFPQVLHKKSTTAPQKKSVPVPENLPTPPPKIQLPPADKPFMLYQEAIEDKPVQQPSFNYQKPFLERKVKEPPPKVKVEAPEIVKVVHYNKFYTPLNEPNIQSHTSQTKKIPVPKSKWFV